MRFLCIAKTESVVSVEPSPVKTRWKVTFQSMDSGDQESMISIVATPEKAARFKVGNYYQCTLGEEAKP